jgi:DNA-binding NarL/FixJ family response regulator
VSAEPAHETGDRLRVLLVDDVADIRLLLRSLFEVHPGVEVVGEAGDGRQAIELAAGTQPDLVVLDLSMPVMDGVEALPAIREAAPGARVVVLSAIPRGVDPGAIAAGAVAYVEKSATSTAHLVQDLLLGAGLLDSAMTQLQGTAQPTTATFARHPASAGRARAFARDAMTSAGAADDSLVETVQLLLSELVTNAIVHASSEPTVAISLLADRVHIEIVDSTTTAVRPRTARADEESGRGLGIVEMLALAWGTTPLPGGKVVWFDVAR